MHFLDDPDEMTAEQRLAEVVAILAAGYLRHDARPFTENPLDCSGGPMAVCDHGLTDRESVPAEVAR
jgi:hypothetical protein